MKQQQELRNWRELTADELAALPAALGRIAECIEAGTFVLNGSRLEFSVAFGQAAGQRGVNNWQLNGNVLVITGANGQGIQLTRQA